MVRSNLENMIIIGMVVFAVLLLIVNIMVFVFVSGEDPSRGTAKALAIMVILAYDIFAVVSLLTPLILARILDRMQWAMGGSPFPVLPCAQPVSPTCPSCGAVIRAGVQYCPYCGSRVAA